MSEFKGHSDNLKAAIEKTSKRLRSAVSTVARTLSRWPRWVRMTIVVLASLLGFLVVLNGALNLGRTRPFLASVISVSPQSLNVDYRRAWFLWPSLVYVRNLQVSGSDVNVQWQVEVDDARLSIDLMALLKREFHATKVRARGVAFRLRQKIDASAATRDRMAPLPAIPGIEGPPIIEEGPPEPDIPNEKYKLWSVRIENVDGLARQLWIDEFHFEGELRVSGAFYLRPKRRLWVGPAKATSAYGSVVIGNERLLDGISWTANCTIPPLDPRNPTGMEFFRFISGALQINAGIPNARALNYYTQIRGSSALFDGGSGGLHLDLVLHSGVARPLNLSLEMNDLKAKKEAWLALGSLQVTAKADSEGPSTWLARIAPFELRQAGTKSAAVRGTEFRLNASTAAIDVSKPLPEIEVHGDLPSAQIPSLRIINTFMSSSSRLHVNGGKGSISAQFDANTATKLARGDLAVGAEGLSAEQGELHFWGRVNAKLHVAKMLLENGDIDVSSARIDARDVTLKDSNAGISNWWSRVTIHEAKFRSNQRIPFETYFSAELQSAAPVIAFSKRTPSVPGWITRFLAGGEVDASGHLHLGKAYVDLSNFKAQTGLLNVKGHFRERGEAKSGVFQVSAGPLSVGIEIKNEDTSLILVGSAVEPPLAAPFKQVSLIR